MLWYRTERSMACERIQAVGLEGRWRHGYAFNPYEPAQQCQDFQIHRSRGFRRNEFGSSNGMVSHLVAIRHLLCIGQVLCDDCYDWTRLGETC